MPRARTHGQNKKMDRLTKVLKTTPQARILHSDNSVYAFNTPPNKTKALRNAGMKGVSTRGFRWDVPKKDRV